jgi:hypothetical protein
MMNLRHTAALALVGWYLMLPPLDPANMTQVDWSAVIEMASHEELRIEDRVR